MSGLLAVRAISFDLGGTLIATKNGAVTYQLADALGVSIDDMRSYLAEGPKTSRSTVEDAANRVADRFGQGDTAGLFEIFESEAEASVHPVLYDDVIETLRELRRRGFAIAFCSNVIGAVAPRQLSDSLYDFADAVVFSCDVGVVKPDAAIFSVVSERLGIPPGEILHVGDSLGADVDGALRAGMQPALIVRTGRPHSFPVGNDHEYLVLDRLTDLLELLPEPDIGGLPHRTSPLRNSEQRQDTDTAAPTGRFPAVDWLLGAQQDPITGLVAFPDFHREFPRRLRSSIRANRTVYLAIGDVDNLKEHVESTNRSAHESFGHLAGYAVMTELGRVARQWFWNLQDRHVVSGAVSTFGGDEIIITLTDQENFQFSREIDELRHSLNASLPCTVSFAIAAVNSDALGELAYASTTDLYLHVMNSLDRALFQQKLHRRQKQISLGSFLLPVHFATGGRDDKPH